MESVVTVGLDNESAKPSSKEAKRETCQKSSVNKIKEDS